MVFCSPSPSWGPKALQPLTLSQVHRPELHKTPCCHTVPWDADGAFGDQ